MRPVITAIPICYFAQPATADVGHWGEIATHDHWAAAIAIGIAAGFAAIGVLKGNSATNDEGRTGDPDDTEQEV